MVTRVETTIEAVPSTVLPGLDFDNQFPVVVYNSFDVTVIPFVNGTAGTDTASFSDGAVLESHTVFWSPPKNIAPLVADGDLEYKVLYWTGTSLPDNNPYSMDELMALNPLTARDWTDSPLPSFNFRNCCCRCFRN